MAAPSTEELYLEHVPGARRAALAMAPPDAADDLVAEAFARTLAMRRRGAGPAGDFGAYLRTAVRNAARDWHAARTRVLPAASPEPPGACPPAEELAVSADERNRVMAAFSALPPRWQQVLWQTEVEEKTPAQLARSSGMSANAVSALALRAREGLAAAWLARHAGRAAPGCQPYAPLLAPGVRGRLTRGQRQKLDTHLARCPACSQAHAELTRLNSVLRGVLAPAAVITAAARHRSPWPRRTLTAVTLGAVAFSVLALVPPHTADLPPVQMPSPGPVPSVRREPSPPASSPAAAIRTLPPPAAVTAPAGTEASPAPAVTAKKSAATAKTPPARPGKAPAAVPAPPASPAPSLPAMTATGTPSPAPDAPGSPASPASPSPPASSPASSAPSPAPTGTAPVPTGTPPPGYF